MKITRKTTFGEIITNFPEAVNILTAHGLHCVGCHIAFTESIEDGCIAHGFNDSEIDSLIEKLNNLIEKH